jgi:membrane protein
MTARRTSGRRGFLRVTGEVLRGLRQHQVGAESARIAFYFFLSFFPLILALFALTGLLGREAAFEWITGELLVALPPETAEQVGEFVAQVTGSRSPSALSIGLVLTVWTASSVFTAFAEGLNRAYRVKQRRRWWKRRALALALLLVLAGASVVNTVLLLAGPEAARLLQIERLESGLRWPLTFLLAVLMMGLIYYWLPNHDQSRSKRWILVGALVGTGMWVVATLAFRLFLTKSVRFAAIYGFVGGMVALLIWLYLTAMSVLVGGEVAAALERRAHARG